MSSSATSRRVPISLGTATVLGGGGGAVVVVVVAVGGGGGVLLLRVTEMLLEAGVVLGAVASTSTVLCPIASEAVPAKMPFLTVAGLPATTTVAVGGSTVPRTATLEEVTVKRSFGVDTASSTFLAAAVVGGMVEPAGLSEDPQPTTTANKPAKAAHATHRLRICASQVRVT